MAAFLLLLVIISTLSVSASIDSVYSMIPKDSLNHNRLPQSYQVSTTSMQQKYSNDRWTLQQISPGNGSLHSPIMDDQGNLYVYRLSIDYQSYTDDLATCSLQILKLSSLSFNVVWFQSLFSNAAYVLQHGTNDPQDITIYVSNRTQQRYVIADTSNNLVILNATNGALVNNLSLPGVHLDSWFCEDKLPCIVDMKWFIDGDVIRVIEQQLVTMPRTYNILMTVYSFETNQVFPTYTLHSATDYLDTSSWTFYTTVKHMNNESISSSLIFRKNASSQVVAMNFTANDGVSYLWTNTDFRMIYKIVVNDVLQRLYSLGIKSSDSSEDTVFLYSTDFDGHLINRYPLTETEIVSDYWGEPLFALSYDHQHLYLYLSVQEALLIHFAIDGDDITSTNSIGVSSVDAMAISTDNKLFTYTATPTDEYLYSIQYVVYDENLNVLWSETVPNSAYNGAGASYGILYSHRTYSTFGTDSTAYWYATDAFYTNHAYLPQMAMKPGYYKINVYGPDTDQLSIVHEWKFWLSVAINILSAIFFIVIQIYDKNTVLKKGISAMNYRRMSDGSDDENDVLLYTKRIKVVVRMVGLIILAILISIVHFEKIQTINSFLDQIGSYDNVRNSYLTNSNSASSNASSTTYTYTDLCFCTDSTLQITGAQCNAGYCYATNYGCSDIIEYFGDCDLSWYQPQCQCTFLVDGCNISIDYNTTVAATVPHGLYAECTETYHVLYNLLWSTYGIHMGFSILYILSALFTRGRTSKIGWITRISSIATLILLVITSSSISSGICTGNGTLLGFNYPGCDYVYPSEFDMTFQALELQTYNNIIGVVLLYGMKTALKFIQVWIPFACTVNDCCLKN